MSKMRLQKFLSAAGVCSRRQGEVYIAEGLVKVNGVVVTELGTQIDPAQDRVEFQGKAVTISAPQVYIALNKPKDYVTSCKQERQKIVLDLIDLPQRIYPIGRLDKDSTGLILLTNDGELHHRLSHPSFNHEREYDVTTLAPIPTGALRKIEKGFLLKGSKTRPAKVKIISPKRFRIVLQEGRNRQIRRMVQKVGSEVEELRRIRVANVKLGRLKEGAWRHLTEKEIRELQAVTH